MPLQSCIGGHGASKSSRDPKTVVYSPRKWPNMREITIFNDAARVVYRGHGALKFSWDRKTMDYRPRKWPEMREITIFYDAPRVMYRGSRGIEILPGTENRGL